jgi:hypothetical protein
MKLVIESKQDFQKWYKNQQFVFAPVISAPALTDSVKTAEVKNNPVKVLAKK